jgi:RNA polymerase subunit RPABC4/transcription elongation factor Spt4
MQEIVKCPKCGRRIFDLEWRGRIVVSIKCTHCRNVVSIEREAIGMASSPKIKSTARKA